ncbi:hypothetical protein JW979_07405 [bacterium]|nr:hypothetical protein [candidate division CSSED10-310 bacterium]
MIAIDKKKELNLENLHKLDRQSLEYISEQLLINATSAINSNADELIEEMYRSASDSLNAIDTLIDHDNELNVKSYYWGICRAIIELSASITRQRSDTTESLKLLYEYKYLKDLVEYLYENEGANHKTLASYLGLSKNGLSNFCMRIKRYNIIYTNNIGREKLYYLSGKGIKLFKNMKSEEQKIDSGSKKEFLIVINTISKLAREFRSTQFDAVKYYYSLKEDLFLDNEQSRLLRIAINELMQKSKEYYTIKKLETNIDRTQERISATQKSYEISARQKLNIQYFTEQQFELINSKTANSSYNNSIYFEER